MLGSRNARGQGYSPAGGFLAATDQSEKLLNCFLGHVGLAGRKVLSPQVSAGAV